MISGHPPPGSREPGAQSWETTNKQKAQDSLLIPSVDILSFGPQMVD